MPKNWISYDVPPNRIVEALTQAKDIVIPFPINYND